MDLFSGSFGCFNRSRNSNGQAKGRIKIWVLRCSRTGQVHYLEAYKDFVDLLLGFLMLRTGALIRLNRELAPVVKEAKADRGIYGVYDSFKRLDDSVVIVDKTILLDPFEKLRVSEELQSLNGADFECCNEDCFKYLAGSRQICRNCSVSTHFSCTLCGGYFPENAHTSLCFTPIRPWRNHMTAAPILTRYTVIQSKNPPADRVPKKEGYVKMDVPFIITNDLVISPFSTSNIAEVLESCGVGSANDLECNELSIGKPEVLVMVGAALTSPTPLTDVFGKMCNKKTRVGSSASSSQLPLKIQRTSPTHDVEDMRQTSVTTHATNPSREQTILDKPPEGVAVSQSSSVRKQKQKHQEITVHRQHTAKKGPKPQPTCCLSSLCRTQKSEHKPKPLSFQQQDTSVQAEPQPDCCLIPSSSQQPQQTPQQLSFQQQYNVDQETEAQPSCCLRPSYQNEQSLQATETQRNWCLSPSDQNEQSSQATEKQPNCCLSPSYQNEQSLQATETQPNSCLSPSYQNEEPKQATKTTPNWCLSPSYEKEQPKQATETKSNCCLSPSQNEQPKQETKTKPNWCLSPSYEKKQPKQATKTKPNCCLSSSNQNEQPKQETRTQPNWCLSPSYQNEQPKQATETQSSCCLSPSHQKEQPKQTTEQNYNAEQAPEFPPTFDTPLEQPQQTPDESSSLQQANAEQAPEPQPECPLSPQSEEEQPEQTSELVSDQQQQPSDDKPPELNPNSFSEPEYETQQPPPPVVQEAETEPERLRTSECHVQQPEEQPPVDPQPTATESSFVEVSNSEHEPHRLIFFRRCLQRTSLSPPPPPMEQAACPVQNRSVHNGQILYQEAVLTRTSSSMSIMSHSAQFSTHSSSQCCAAPCNAQSIHNPLFKKTSASCRRPAPKAATVLHMPLRARAHPQIVRCGQTAHTHAPRIVHRSCLAARPRVRHTTPHHLHHRHSHLNRRCPAHGPSPPLACAAFNPNYSSCEDTDYSDVQSNASDGSKDGVWNW